MESVFDLYDEIRTTMPDSFADVDRNHIKQWGSLSSDYTYSWFESLANAMNDDMRQKVRSDRYSRVVSFMENALKTATPEVYNCVDVSFVENLFWQVPPAKAEGYWAELPVPLQALYIAFHGRSPLS